MDFEYAKGVFKTLYALPECSTLSSLQNHLNYVLQYFDA